MPLYRWRCEKCGEATRKLLASRPKLGTCCCGGKLIFVTNAQAMVMESLDNGIMPRRVEQLKDVEELRKVRSDIDLKTDPNRGNLV